MAAARDLRAGRISINDLFGRLASDQRLGLTAAQLNAIATTGRAHTGDAQAQVDAFASKVDAIAAKDPAAGRYEPGEIL